MNLPGPTTANPIVSCARLATRSARLRDPEQPAMRRGVQRPVARVDPQAVHMHQARLDIDRRQRSGRRSGRARAPWSEL